MKPSTPIFWYESKGFFAKVLPFLLYPLGKFYALLSLMKYSCTVQKKLPAPVICVGNFTVGGSGKTPTVIALTHVLKDHFQKNPAILTRGYGSKIIKQSKKPYVVQKHDCAKNVGDEPLLLAHHAPTFIHKNRYACGYAAIQNHADALILDDGLQNPSLYKDFNLLVVDGLQRFGNGFIFPSGPLRQSLNQGLKHVHAVLLIDSTGGIGEETWQHLRKTIQHHGAHVEIFTGIFESDPFALPPQPILAFAGIGYPEKFRQFLANKGYDVLEFLSFPDHHQYTEKDLLRLQSLESRYGVPIFTTEKDAVKLRENNLKNLYTVSIRLHINEKDRFLDYLAHRIPSLKGLDPLN